ncbi:4-hydroxyphenylacetate 3-monooxygenase, reductase component [Mannheimia sp. AT1]|uniref:4-hydroxyphenylacetate 3-monooxygenase reductase component n=1 Tax=Mannheimia cairinae TaxID=3025936 RepID=A0ABT5MQM4_9PAST|nr:4-hydroxyphenylacetate 3-monooxygenase, reductase component [Mannheimia cairinae]MDD0824489.1 4-hydroxyphenylacetate 3-monooxygenase, reductase component [Mannheimia cairinae]MDD0825590.1 4-hydroxyphenylacetate 3-monooxygenase, reductase component [Mannheimia cairinae]
MSHLDTTKITEFAAQFREAMAHLSSAVSIVTTNGLAGKAGLTVSSVTSVTDTPATLLFCINKNSHVHDIIKQNGKVCINVLSHEQEELAKHFAAMLNSTMEERFEWNIWNNGFDKQPVLQGAISALQGNIVDMHSVGTHTIFIVQLSHIDVAPNHSLVYFGRQFKQVTIA